MSIIADFESVLKAAASFRSIASSLEAAIIEPSITTAETLAQQVIAVAIPDPLEAGVADVLVQVAAAAVQSPGAAGANLGVPSLGKIGGAGGAGR